VTSNLKFAFVVPRYGTEVVGGAELAARMIAERLVRQTNWQVEIFTTCAKDHVTWVNEYPEGTETINGVVVHRFPTTSGRPQRFFPYSERVLSFPEATTTSEAEAFLDLQGPGCEPLVDGLRNSDRDLFAFYPYLYTTTAQALPQVAERSIMHPAAHDEPALHLSIFRRPLILSRGLVFHTYAERFLVQRLFPVASTPQIVMGLGFEEPSSDLGPGRDPGAIAGIGERPYLLYVGRVEGFKGTTMLGTFFASYKERRPGPLALVMSGPVNAQPPPHPDVIVTGPVDEADKWALMRGATAFVHPSTHESFSIVLLEAWSVGLPAVVNERCTVTYEQVARSGGGLWFDSYAQFEAVVDRLLEDGNLRRTLGENGRAFVEQNYRWPTIIDRYTSFVDLVLDGDRHGDGGRGAAERST
jgi:glycosyltransferase involved in cell wall biosynthesis